MAPQNTKEVDRKAAQRDEGTVVDHRQQDQLERIENGEATKEGLGGWAALATQRSTAHVVGAGPKTHGTTGMTPLVVDPNDGTEQPVLLGDQIASNKGIEEETNKILANQPGNGPRDEDPQGKNAVEDEESEDDETEDDESEDDEAVEPVDPEAHTKEELLAIAAERGVEIEDPESRSTTKAMIAEAINAADEDDEEE